MKKQTIKKIAGISAAVAVAFSAGVGAGFVLDHSEPVMVPMPFEVTREVAVPYNVTEYVTVEKEVEVEKIIEVPLNGTEDVIEFIIDEEGNLSELDLSEIEDHGFDELIRQVAFIQESKLMAADYVKKEFADEADKYNVSGTIIDEDDVERLRIADDLDELIAEDIDFEDSDVDVTVKGTFEHDDVDYEFESLVEIKDGKVADFTIESISVK